MEEPRRLGGRYELGSVLGRGGMAEVYIAHDSRLGRTVAVKTLRVDLARDPSFQARFRREAQSAASLNHPSIVAVYDTGEDYVDGVSIPYIVMEYVDGSTLRELLHSGRKLLPERSLEMTVGILQALEYSHRSGIVHRDIKPANVMLTRQGQVKVMDFGIARAMGDSGMTMTQTAAVIGTAQYLSPEQAKGETVDARSDLYSAGCLLYELLTVRPPFVGDSPVAVAYQHVREEPQPPSVYDPEVSPDMDAIVLKALTKDPDYRYQSADEMRADIEACLDGQPVGATVALGAVGYGGGYGGYGNDSATTAMPPQHDAGTSMLPPMRDDDGGFGYDQQGPGGSGRRKPKKSNTSTILLVVAAVLVLIGAIFMGKAIFSGKNGAAGTVSVPAFVGVTKAEAETKAKNADVTISFGDTVFCADQPKGNVCKQSADPNASIPKDQTVTLNLSKGAEKIDVPDVTGDKFDDAEQTLKDAGFEVDKQSQTSDKEEGTVLKQDPNGGEKRAKGATITLTVAVAPEEVTIKNVEGKSKDEATQILKADGLQVTSSEEESADHAAGTVIRTDPGAGNTVKAGDTVNLVIAKPPSTNAIPNLQGQTVGQVRGMAAELGLNLVVLPPNANDAAVVQNQNPGQGTQMKPGDTLTIYVQDPNGGGNNGGGGFIDGGNGG